MKTWLSVLFLATVSVALLGAGAGASAGAGGDSKHRRSLRPFLGLWEGVDLNDGSKRTISITDRDGDGIAFVASRDTYWTLCDGDRGIERASGGVRHDGVLETKGLVTCFETSITVHVMQTYELSQRDDTLFATPHGTSLEPITLHRVSE